MKARELIAKLKKNPEFVKAYEELEPQYQIAREIIRLRVERGWTQEQLAQKACTRQANISRLENAVGTPSVSMLLRVAKALHARLCVHLETPQELSQATANEVAGGLQVAARLPPVTAPWTPADVEQKWHDWSDTEETEWTVTYNRPLGELRTAVEAA